MLGHIVFLEIERKPDCYTTVARECHKLTVKAFILLMRASLKNKIPKKLFLTNTLPARAKTALVVLKSIKKTTDKSTRINFVFH
jgi:hypothetical protein